MRKNVGSEWRFNILSANHLQGQVTLENPNECGDALVCIGIGRWKSNILVVRMVRSGDWCISILFVK